jgi:hypothetical protein
MKFTDVRTIKTLIKEYGMDSGAATYGSNKSVMAPNSSPSKKTSASPTVNKASQSPTTSGTAKKEQPKILAVRASDVPADAVVKDIKDKPMGTVVSRVGDKPKADALVVDTGKPGQKQYQVLDKNQKVFIDNPEYKEESAATKLISKLKIKNKKLRSVKKILRNSTGTTGIDNMKESVFGKFDRLPLEEQLRILEKVDADKLNEAWSKKYKDSINCSDPKGFSQKAHCVGKKETNEEEVRLDPKCWKGKKIGNPKTKVKGGVRVNNCVPESVDEGAVPDNRKARILNKIMAKPLLASDIGAQMEAFFAIPDPLMVNEFRKQRAIAGDDIDLRPVVKGFIGSVLHPDLQKQVNVSESVINEYDDLGKEKEVIIKTVSGLDAADKEQASILDRIYKILNSGQISSNIDVAFTKPLVDENLPEAEKANVRRDMTRIISSLEQDYGSMKKFLDRLEQAGGVVNVAELSKPLNTFEKVFGDNAAIAAFITLANYGVGKKQKGPGEYALACLSDQIKLAEGEGDLQINGIGKTELKAALSSAGGRIGYGGGSQKSKRAVIDKYAQYLPTVLARLNAGGGGSISIRPFIDALNTDLPTNNPDNVKVRKALMTELLTMDLEKFAAPVVDKFATSMNFDEIETEYLIQNFAWYKDRDDFDALLLIHVPNRKTAMIRNAEDLITFRNSGHANATSISIVPTQAGAGREQWAQLTLNKAKAG